MVYFIISKTDNLVKIGYSNTPRIRLSTLIREHKKPLEIYNVIDGDRDIERYFHYKHKEYHVKGEWFRSDLLLLNDYDVCYNDYLLENIIVPIPNENQEFTKPLGVYLYDDQKERVEKLAKRTRKSMSLLFWEAMEKVLAKHKL